METTNRVENVKIFDSEREAKNAVREEIKDGAVDRVSDALETRDVLQAVIAQYWNEDGTIGTVRVRLSLSVSNFDDLGDMPSEDHRRYRRTVLK